MAFNNRLQLLNVTAQELRDVLEHGVALAPEAAGQFPQLAGIEIVIDTSFPEGSRVREAKITGGGENIPLVSEGALASNDTFRVVTLNFLAGGGDGYPFPQCQPTDQACLDRVDLVDLTEVGLPEGNANFADPGSEQDAFAEYLIENFPVDGSKGAFFDIETPPSEDTRINQL